MKNLYLLNCSKIDSNIWFPLSGYFDLAEAMRVKESKEKTNPDWLYRIDIVSVY